MCVIALTDSRADIDERLKNYQRYVHGRFNEAYRKLQKNQSPFNVQFGMVKLKWHLELQKLLYATQKVFTLDRVKLNYLLLTADNEAFAVVAPSNCMGRCEREVAKELNAAIADFLEEEGRGKKDYFSNYKVPFAALLSRDDDTLFRVFPLYDR